MNEKMHRVLPRRRAENAIRCCYADYGAAKQSTGRQLSIALVTGYLEE